MPDEKKKTHCSLYLSDYGSDRHITVNLTSKLSGKNTVTLKVELRLSESYPESLPDIRLDSPQLKRDILTILCKDARDCANQHQGECMIFSVIENIQDNLEKFCDSACPVESDIISEDINDVWNVLLYLDHMRAKNKYVKTIQKWTQELGIKGRLFFYGKLIFILLQGEYTNVKVSPG